MNGAEINTRLGDSAMRQQGSGNALVLYALRQYPLRASVADHLYAFARHSSYRTFYVNLALRAMPRSFRKLEFDLVVFHTTLLGLLRWAPELADTLLERAAPVKGLPAVRVAFPQDEFLNVDVLASVIDSFDIHHVFSVAPESEWPKIYAPVDRSRVRFSRVLTGYLEPDSVAHADAGSPGAARSVDIAYRAKNVAPWLGRHGRLKGRLAEVVKEAAPRYGLAVDISTRAEDTLLGNDWVKFLAEAKYTIGVEGGASVLDRDGTIKSRTESYVERHPEANVEAIEAACFPGEDGKLDLRAISPRHLEACATRTCQILLEGDYNGILCPGEHYLELRSDFSNLGEILETVAKDDKRATLTESAYRDVVASGRFTYRSFVEEVEDRLAEFLPVVSDGDPGVSLRMRHAIARVRDRASWGAFAVRVQVLLRLVWVARLGRRLLRLR